MAVVTGNPATENEPQASGNLTLDDPWRWMSAGWRDMWAMPGISLFYGVLFAGISLLLVLSLFLVELSAIVLPLAAGFMLVGPLFAVGLYEASRRLENGEALTLKDVLLVKTASPTQLAFLGALLMLALLAWMRIASLLFALFFGLEGFPPLPDFLPTLILTPYGLGLLVVGTAVGAFIAFAVFAVSALSVPMLMHRDVDAISAVLASVRVVRENPGPMLLWAWIIAVVMAVGMATFFVGMVFAFPLVGHATWHAYRASISDAD
ncbi:hypothetical protein RHODOSMS8_02167 [Rhodobiaceae bacterium]|nr:hypothetical protein RHODOSMS8_02167 [Rhodobiaceae bacterium]